MKLILLVRKLLGLVEMTSGLVNASFSLPEWQAVKMIFFAPCMMSFVKKKTRGKDVVGIVTFDLIVLLSTNHNNA